MNREIQPEAKPIHQPENRLAQDGAHALTNPESKLKPAGQAGQGAHDIPKDFGNHQSFDFGSAPNPYKDATQGPSHSLTDGKNPTAQTPPEGPAHSMTDGKNTVTPEGGMHNLGDGRNPATAPAAPADTTSQPHTISDGRNRPVAETPQGSTPTDGKNHDVPQGSTPTDGRNGNSLSDGKDNSAADRSRELLGVPKVSADGGKKTNDTPAKEFKPGSDELEGGHPPAEKPAPPAPGLKDMWLSGVGQMLGL